MLSGSMPYNTDSHARILINLLTKPHRPPIDANPFDSKPEKDKPRETKSYIPTHSAGTLADDNPL